MKNSLFIAMLFMYLSSALQGQFLNNPSFEGTPQQGTPPSSWTPFDASSSPDTDPVSPDNFTAADGQTFITLVSRGMPSSFPNTFENVHAQLSENLENGVCYLVSLDVVSRDNLGFCSADGTYIEYLEATNLKIYGSNASSVKGELLAESEAIMNTEWESLDFIIKPASEVSWLTLEVGLTDVTYGFGNISVDNISISQLGGTVEVVFNESISESDLPITLSASAGISYAWEPESGLSCFDCQNPQVLTAGVESYKCTITDVNGCSFSEIFILVIDTTDQGSIDSTDLETEEIVIPNVFTPNGDGINDYFEVLNLPPYTTLVVFNRNGREVFAEENYQNQWNGLNMHQEPLPEGTYWYVLVTPGLSKNLKGEVYIKRE